MQPVVREAFHSQGKKACFTSSCSIGQHQHITITEVGESTLLPACRYSRPQHLHYRLLKYETRRLYFETVLTGTIMAKSAFKIENARPQLRPLSLTCRTPFSSATSTSGRPGKRSLTCRFRYPSLQIYLYNGGYFPRP